MRVCPYFFSLKGVVRKNIRFFDMFSGIGGFREGLNRAGGFSCVGHCEIDKYADRSYRAIFNTEGEWFCNDAKKIRPEELPEFDLLCGGFPCQAFSVAGKRQGFEDARGTLFFEIARLVKARRPPYLLLENVPGLLSHNKGATFNTILYTLYELGYHVEWQVLNSKDFGVPQSRKRVYLIGYLDERCAGKILPFTGANKKALVQIVPGCQGSRVYSKDGLSCTITSTAGGMGGKTGLVRYDLNSQNGEIYAICSNMTWDQDAPEAEYINEFQVQSWKYTKNGYFFIEEYDRQGYDGYHGKIGFRVEPLDEACRELNRKYVMPVGYAGNKLFITNWNQSDYSQLDFYDLYEIMYLLKYEKYVPYNYSQEGVEYYIPKQDFEEVIQTFLTVESEVLESNAIYNAETKTYLYRPRGLYDYGSTYEPYPEVVSYEKMDDGKIKLIINAVWERTMQDNAMTSELVIQPLDNNRFHYISNQVIKSNLDDTSKWYRNRLTYGEWNKIYKENDEIK